jgi:hypothetical protein
MISWIILSQMAAAKPICAAVEPVADRTQVVWLSPTWQSAGSRRNLEVFELADVQAYVKRAGPDKVRMLQKLGQIGSRGWWSGWMEWKVVIFDVEASSLCRPLRGGEPGEVVGGVPICHKRLQSGGARFTGCGYSKDTQTGARGLDHFRIPWSVASQWGFCVMPLDRVLQSH